MNILPIEDMSKTYLEHSMVIHNFVIKIGNQIKDSLCRVFGDSVQYQWRENDDNVVIPDASIICNMRDRKNVSFTGIPRFVMEVLSDSTEEYDRNEKMQLYCKVGISEYWIVDWRKKQVEIYMFSVESDSTSITKRGIPVNDTFFLSRILQIIETSGMIILSSFSCH